MEALINKVIFLTGGADGIGWECAKAYAQEGAHVCIADVNEKYKSRIEELRGGGHIYIVCNATIEADVKEAMKVVLKKYQRLDAIHNNAGTANPSKPLHTTTVAEWDVLMNVNLKSIYYTTVHGIEALKKSKGCILNTSSLVGNIGQDNHAAYVASKGAVNALTRAMALDYAKDGIRINAVAPAAIRTPMLDTWSKDQPHTREIEDYLNKLQPLGPCPEGDVVAEACVFLLSSMARFITGCILPVSGGAELGYRKILNTED